MKIQPDGILTPERRMRVLMLLRNPAALRAKVESQLYYLIAPVLCFLAGLYRKWRVSACHIIVVVGSFGKSTTAHAVAHALDCVSSSQILRNNLPRVAFGILRLRRNTPMAVFEVGIAFKGQMNRFAKMLRPDVVVVTSVGSEHQENLGPLDAIREEKGVMVRALLPGGLAILNGDDANVLWMRSLTKARIVTCGLDPANDVRATRYALHYPPRMSVSVALGATQLELNTRLVGKPAIFSLLAALALAREHAVPVECAVRRLEEVAPLNRRMRPVALPHGAWGMVDDRKALPETIGVAIRSLCELPATRRWIVFGEIGLPPDEDVAAHYRKWGQCFGGACDELVLTTANSEMRDHLVAGATEAGFAMDHIYCANGDLAAVVACLRNRLQPGDAVLIKGRFHERLIRIALALEGLPVTCQVRLCEPRALDCRNCNRLCAP